MQVQNSIKNPVENLEEKRKLLNKKFSQTAIYYFLVPILSFIISALTFKEGPAILFIPAFFSLMSFIVYYTKIQLPFNDLKNILRELLLREFFSIYHPDIEFKFFPDKKYVRSIIRGSGLIKPDIYKEEDVIIGSNKDLKFYLSEIHLQKQANKSTHTIFKGIMFKLNIPGKQFPNAQIQSKPGLLNFIFKTFSKNDEFNFYYETDNETRFQKELKFLFPFIRHLIAHQGDLRIRTKGNEMVILLESKMKFLDDPKPRLSKSFLNDQYYENIGKQLNTLLFIMESFSKNMDETEIEERLELKALDLIKATRDNSAEL